MVQSLPTLQPLSFVIAAFTAESTAGSVSSYVHAVAMKSLSGTPCGNSHGPPLPHGALPPVPPDGHPPPPPLANPATPPNALSFCDASGVLPPDPPEPPLPPLPPLGQLASSFPPPPSIFPPLPCESIVDSSA